MYWLTTVALAVSCLSCSIDAGAVIAMAEVCRAAGAKKITLCSALGFNGADGNSVYESVFSQGFGDQVVVARDESDIDVGSSDVAVAMVKTVELNGDMSRLQITMQNIMEEAMYRGKTANLIVIITGIFIFHLKLSQ